MGFDAVRIDRMEKKLKGEAFCRRAFSEEENALFARKKHPAPTAAANFAAKEALAKALRCGIFGFDLREAPGAAAGGRFSLFRLFGGASPPDGTGGACGGALPLP